MDAEGPERVRVEDWRKHLKKVMNKAGSRHGSERSMFALAQADRYRSKEGPFQG